MYRAIIHALLLWSMNQPRGLKLFLTLSSEYIHWVGSQVRSYNYILLSVTRTVVIFRVDFVED